MSKEAILSTMWIGYGDDGIIRVRIQKKVNITVEDLRLMYRTMEHLASGSEKLIFVDASEEFTVDKEVFDYARSQSGGRIGTAILISNPISRSLINTYITVMKPESRFKIFTSEEKAIEWLREMEAERKTGKLD
jgi:hypothetical protein